MSFIRKRQQYSLNRMFDFDVVRGDECAWRKGADGSIAIVRREMARNDVLVTRYAYKVSGGLFDQQIVPKGKGQTMIKRSDPRMTTENYGGYNKVSGAYFILVEHSRGKNSVRSIAPVYIMDRALYERDAIAYCEDVLGLENPRVLIPRIKVDSLVAFDGFRMWVSGRQPGAILYKNANQLVLSWEENAYIKWIVKYVERCQIERIECKINAHDMISSESNCALYRTLLDKLRNSCYAAKYAAAAETICENYDSFVRLALPDQCRILLQILNLFRTNGARTDLKVLCGKSRIGILLTSKNLDGYAGH